MARREEIITGLDIGSTAIRAVVARIEDGDAGKGIHVIGVGETPSEGVSRGVITSIDEAVTSITNALENVERMSGVPVESAFVSMCANHIVSQTSKGVIAVSKANGEINEQDVQRVLEAAQTVATPPNYEVLHVIPRSFSVDGQQNIKDPVGMTGMRLEVECQIIQGLSSLIKNVTKAVYRTSVDIDQIVFSPLAVSESVLSRKQKEIGVALVNIGSGTSSVAVFEEGDLLHTAVIPVGSGHITSDIAIGLRTSLEAAEKIKQTYGIAVPSKVMSSDKIAMRDFGEEDTMVPRKQVAEIIEARLEEIFDLVDSELRKIQRSGVLPAGIVITGGGAKLQGIVELAKDRFKLPASIGSPAGIASSIDKVNDPAYSVAAGLAMWGAQAYLGNIKRSRAFSSFDKATGQIKGWFKSLMP